MNMMLEDDQLVRAIAWTLLHTLWQGALFAALLGLLLRAMRTAAANVRYVVACGALVMLVAAALATFVVLAQPPHRSIVATPRVERLPDKSPIAPFALAERAIPAAASAEFDTLYYLVVLYLAGAMTMCVWHVGGWLMVLRMRRGPVIESMQPLLSRLAERMQVRRAVRVVESAAAEVPAVIGVFRPVIVLPVALLGGMPPQQVEAILAHELAHVRRHDYLINVLQSAVETLMFYHPATWWISAQVRCERENCADDLAARACGDGRAYAAALAAFESTRGPAPAQQPHLAPAATHGNLLDRVRRVLNLPPLPRPFSPARSLIAAVLMIACVIVPLACAAQQQQERAVPANPANPANPATATTAVRTATSAPAAGKVVTERAHLRITTESSAPDKQFLEIVIAMSGLHHANKYIEIDTLRDRLAELPEADRRRTVLVVKADAPDVTVDHYFRHLADLHRLVADEKLAYLSQAGIVERAVASKKRVVDQQATKAQIEVLRARLADAESGEDPTAAARVQDLRMQLDQLERRSAFDRELDGQLREPRKPTKPTKVKPPRTPATRPERGAEAQHEVQRERMMRQAEQVARQDESMRRQLETLTEMEATLKELARTNGPKSRAYADAKRELDLQRQRIDAAVQAFSHAREETDATKTSTRPATSAAAGDHAGDAESLRLLDQRSQMQEALEQSRSVLGDSHPSTKVMRHRLADIDRKLAELGIAAAATKPSPTAAADADQVAALRRAEQIAQYDPTMRQYLKTLGDMEQNLARLGQSLGPKHRTYVDAQHDVDLHRQRVVAYAEASAAATTSPATAATTQR